MCSTGTRKFTTKSRERKKYLNQSCLMNSKKFHECQINGQNLFDFISIKIISEKILKVIYFFPNFEQNI